jgi:hypothetical protein
MPDRLLEVGAYVDHHHAERQGILDEVWRAVEFVAPGSKVTRIMDLRAKALPG